MLKIRVMPTLLYRGHGLVKGVRFDASRRVGAAAQAVRVYNMREVDELIFLDIAATLEHRIPDLDLVDELADVCFVPFTVGGGVRSIDDVRALLKFGADKISVNSAFADQPELVSDIAAQFGSQCVVVSIDARRANGGYQAYVQAGTSPTGRTPTEMAIQAERLGAGEILLTSIERDGTMEGYDLDLIESVVRAVRIPVIASGGAGNYHHMVEALEVGASAVAAASIFHFTEMTPQAAKAYIGARGFPVRA